ncbi:hypothetical protein EDC96DRAFT_519371 [Choanephora cucurbitarum]|nr:hypothetical protein EDC96DRAFT_519371 [Choanephora cucurbitarum]
MSDHENNVGSPIEGSKKRRQNDEELDFEQDDHEDRHHKRLAVTDPETKAPQFIPSAEDSKEGLHCTSDKAVRRKKWEEHNSDDEVALAGEEDEQHAQDNDSDQPPLVGGENVAIRSLVGTKDAGVIIGRGGKNVSNIRELSSARVTISEIVPGAFERILTVTGPVNAVAKAYALISEKILHEHTQQEEGVSDNGTLLIKLLVPDSKMGTLIGKGGSIIKSIQEESGARLNASEDPLPLSTERTVSIQGTPGAVQQAVQRIAKILMEHNSDHRAITNLVHYRPIPLRNINQTNSRPTNGYNNMRSSNSHHHPAAAAAAAAAAMGYMPMGGLPLANNQFYYPGNTNNSGYNRQDYSMGMAGMGGMAGINNMAGLSAMGAGATAAQQAQQIFIPNEMVGCIIGKGGSKINEIRQLSGSHIKIADPHGDANERLVTITGTPESNQMALYLLYSRLESEKARLGLRHN